MKTRTVGITLLVSLLVPRAAGADYELAVHSDREIGVVSPELMGFNAIYCNEPDALWRSGEGKIPTLLAGLNAKLIRFPAGTVVTFWHWNDPNVPGHKDSWDPHYDRAKDLPATETMNIDEYLSYCARRQTTPLVGVNMGSGMRWHREADGIAEARALVRHCMASGVKVVYYYLDNEPYQPDANYPFKAAEYADQINRYVPALKAENPEIKIIVNLHPGANQKGYDYTRTVVEQAGANIDFVDIHMYWRHGSATFAHWIEEPRMMHQRARPYAEQRAFYRKMFAEAGYPAIDLAALEWNVGPCGHGQQAPTEAESALMAGEQFMQFIQSGMKLAAFWPLHWEGGGGWNRAALNVAGDCGPNKAYGMFAQFAGAGGCMQVADTLDAAAEPERLTHLAVRDPAGRTVTVFLINKNQTKPAIDVEVDLSALAGFGDEKVVGFESTDTSSGPLAVHPIEATRHGERVSFAMPRNSFARLTVTQSETHTP